MKRHLLAPLLICLTLILAIYPVVASPTVDEGLYGMAQYFPSNTDIFVATRIDEDFVDDIDKLALKLTRDFTSYGIPSMPLSQLAQFGLGINVNDMLGWMGDYGAFAQYPNDDPALSGYVPDVYSVVIQLGDFASANEFITENLAGLERTEIDDKIIFTDGYMEVILTASTMEIYLNGSQPFMTDETLLDTQNYRESVAQLPYDDYNIAMYFNAESLLNRQNFPVESNMGGVAVGFTTVDEATYIIDAAHAPLEYNKYDGSGQVDTTFLSNIPDTMTTVALASDLSHVVSASLDTLDVITSEQRQFSDSPDPDPYEQFAELGIDLQADVLDWMTGEYAVFGDTDLVPIVKDALAFELNLSGRFKFGVVSDASIDPAAAQRLADSLYELLLEAPVDDTVTIRKDVISGVDVTVIAVNQQIVNPLVEVECNQPPAMSDLSFELVLGVTDDLFVFATRPLADTLLSGDYQGIDTTDDYQNASQYFLPDPTSIWYADGEGFVHSVIFNPVIALTIMGPQIGCIFESIVAQLGNEGTATPAPTPTAPPTPTPDFQAIDEQVRPLEMAATLVQSASITSTVTDDGVIQVRFVITLN